MGRRVCLGEGHSLLHTSLNYLILRPKWQSGSQVVLNIVACHTNGRLSLSICHWCFNNKTQQLFVFQYTKRCSGIADYCRYDGLRTTVCNIY